MSPVTAHSITNLSDRELIAICIYAKECRNGVVARVVTHAYAVRDWNIANLRQAHLARIYINSHPSDVPATWPYIVIAASVGPQRQIILVGAVLF